MQKVENTVLLNAPVLLENTQPGPTIFTDDQSHTSITWEGAGDTGGRDIQAIPLSFLENINFLRILNRGILTVYDAPEDVKKMIDVQLGSSKLRDQAVAWRAQENAKSEDRAIAINHVANQDLVAVKCVGPGSRQGAKCDAEVPVRELNLGEKPPLCEQHKHLASSFVPEIGENVDGKQVTNWVLPRLERR